MDLYYRRPEFVCPVYVAKVWVLTGDKEETAVNISYSAGHFKKGMVELRLTGVTDTQECEEKLRKQR